MTTKREQVFEALFATLKTTVIANLQVERNQPLPDQIPAAGLVVQRDGKEAPPPVETYLAAPPVYLYDEIVEVEVAVQLADDAQTQQREIAIDAIVAAVTTALTASRTRSGLADDLRIGLPKMSDIAVAGAAPIKSATIPVRVWYATSDAGT
jgi:hypothetical protein